MWPNSVSMPVAVTNAFPAVVNHRTPEHHAFWSAMARGTRSGLPSSPGFDSPVRRASSALRLIASRMRPSAATRSPVWRTNMSPGLLHWQDHLLISSRKTVVSGAASSSRRCPLGPVLLNKPQNGAEQNNCQYNCAVQQILQKKGETGGD